MFALIKKDIIFTKKWILLSVVYAVVATWLIMHEGATNILFTFFLVPFFVTSLPFTKIMSIEDNSDTRDFIRRLPVSKYLVVFSRAVFILFMLLISSISLFVIQTIGFNVEYNTDMLIKIASIILIFLLYFMLQLGVSLEIFISCITINPGNYFLCCNSAWVYNRKYRFSEIF